MPYDCGKVMAIANKYNIPVIEDAAEGMGSRFNGQVLVPLDVLEFSLSTAIK